MSDASPSLLNQIHSPADLRKLSIDELSILAKEMRERIFAAVSKNGGHLASNLGVREDAKELLDARKPGTRTHTEAS